MVTQHSITIGGQVIPYSVTCGTIVLKEESEAKGENEGEAEGEKPKATIFFIAYTRDGVDDPCTASDNLFVQWRAGFVLGLAAPGSAGATGGWRWATPARCFHLPGNWWITLIRC